MRILVVEDDRKVSSFIRQGLEEEGHTVEAAADGVVALAVRAEVRGALNDHAAPQFR